MPNQENVEISAPITVVTTTKINDPPSSTISTDAVLTSPPSTNQQKKYFDIKVTGFTTILGIYLTLIVRELIDKSLIVQGVNFSIPQYIFFFCFLLLIIQHYFGALGAFSQAHLFKLMSDNKRGTYRDLFFFQIDFILQMIEFSGFYYLAHNITDVDKAAKALLFVLCLDFAWSMYAYILDSELKGKPDKHTRFWVLKYFLLLVILITTMYANEWHFYNNLILAGIMACSVLVEIWLNSEFHIMAAPEVFHNENK